MGEGMARSGGDLPPVVRRMGYVGGAGVAAMLVGGVALFVAVGDNAWSRGAFLGMAGLVVLLLSWSFKRMIPPTELG